MLNIKEARLRYYGQEDHVRLYGDEFKLEDQQHISVAE